MRHYRHHYHYHLRINPVYCGQTSLLRVPGEIKRREVELDPQVSPEEIMSREVELDPQVSPKEIMSRDGLLSLRLFLNSSATDIVLVTLSSTAV